MREPNPFYRKPTRAYYVQIDDRQIPLGRTKRKRTASGTYSWRVPMKAQSP
jgi:hypothetical protein